MWVTGAQHLLAGKMLGLVFHTRHLSLSPIPKTEVYSQKFEIPKITTQSCYLLVLALPIRHSILRWIEKVYGEKNKFVQLVTEVTRRLALLLTLDIKMSGVEVGTQKFKLL